MLPMLRGSSSRTTGAGPRVGEHRGEVDRRPAGDRDDAGARHQRHQLGQRLRRRPAPPARPAARPGRAPAPPPARSSASGSTATASTSSAPKRSACLRAWKPSMTVSSGSRRALRKRTVSSWCPSRAIMTPSAGTGRAGRDPRPWPGRGRCRPGRAGSSVALGEVPAGEAGRAGLPARGRRPQAFDDLRRLLERAVGQDDEELLAAEADDRVGAAQLRVPGDRAFAQDRVAGEVAVGVVVGLEVVDVDDRQAERRLGAAGPRHLARQLLVERAPVRQAGEGVAAGQGLDLGQQLLAFGLDPLQLGDVGGAGVDQRLVRRPGSSSSAASASCRPWPGSGSRSRPTRRPFEEPRRLGVRCARGRRGGRARAGGRRAVPRRCSRGSSSQAALSSTQWPSHVERGEHVVGEVEEAPGAQVGAGAAGDDDAGQEHHHGQRDRGEEPAGAAASSRRCFRPRPG